MSSNEPVTIETDRTLLHHPCQDCGALFALPDDTAALFPGWVPQRCTACQHRICPLTPLIPPGEALSLYSDGPDTGIFVTGSCEPNPGRGGSAAVRVVNGAILTERASGEPATTSNRMELAAIIQGLLLATPRERVTLYTNSEIASRTLRDWAPIWRRNGWRRGPKLERIANLDLVQEAFETYEARPNAEVRWLNAAGVRWIHYARAVARAQIFPAA